MPVIKNCLHCKTVFDVKPSHAERRKYCSKLCADGARRADKICLNCEKTYTVNNYKKHSNKYCSKECQRTFETVIITCEYCKNNFSIAKCYLETKKYCSMHCYRFGYAGIVETCGVMQKICSICKEPKPYFAFDTVRDNKTGIKEKCKNCAAKISAEKNKNLRNAVLEAYGKKCSCCGETGENFLTVDHINNDGNVERKSKIYSSFYRHLIRENFPKDRYQLLCWNCNMAKARLGYCPHKQQVSELYI